MATTAKPTSRTPLMEAENGSSPSSMCRKIFSSTTMASSTTSPMASTSASSVSVLIVNPAMAIRAKAPIKATGMVTSGMMEARRVRRKTKITKATNTTDSRMVINTLCIDFSMNTELSLAMLMVTPGGRSACSLGISALTPLLSSSGLAVAWRMTPAPTATLPLSRMPLRSSAAASSTRAMSRMRTGKPLTFLMMMSENWPGLDKSVCEVTLNSRCVDSMRPAGTSRLLRRRASSTSWVVSL